MCAAARIPERLPSAPPVEALVDAAHRFGTPLFVTDARVIDEAVAALETACPDPWLRQFSVKANDVVGIVARLASRGLGANVVSRGEWAIAKRAGLPNSRITLEGIGKTDADLGDAIRAARAGEPLRWLSIESSDELAALISLLGPRRRRRAGPLDLLFRLNPDVAPETLPGLAVGHGASKFGMDETELSEAVERAAATPGLRPRGIHLHVGSQLGAVDAWRDAVRRSLALGALLRGGLESFDTLDVGGGFPVLPRGDPAPDPARFLRELGALVEATPVDRRPTRWAVEPGRWLVARAGWLVGRVLHVRRRGESVVVVIDAGMTELIRPALYGARHPIVALTSTGGPIADPALATDIAEPVRVDGPICESTDTIGEAALPPLERGDLVAVADAGAYGASMSSAYNGRVRPPQVLLEPDGSLVLIRRRGRH
ncbi:MAG: diaminopimelate decarboxylase [Chloroflexota bacterium]